MVLDLATVKAIYRQAIDADAHDAEGEAWWTEVATEVQAKVDVSDGAAAAYIIAWWHTDWSAVDDTPASAARRIRMSASRMPRRH